MAKTLVSQSNIKLINVRSAGELTTSYVSSDIFKIHGGNQLQLLISFVKGNSDGCRIMLEFSEDKVNWYQESMITRVSSSSDVKHSPVVRRVEESGDMVISVPVSACFLRVGSQAITSGTNTSLSIVATIASI